MKVKYLLELPKELRKAFHLKCMGNNISMKDQLIKMIKQFIERE